MSRPTLEHCALITARTYASRSTCSRLKVGCVITNEDMTTIYSVGYNGNAKGLPNCCDTKEPGKCGCIHSECNALLKADYSIKNKKMFITHSPCIQCAKLIVNAGISAIYYVQEYRDQAPLELLKQAGVSIYKLC